MHDRLAGLLGFSHSKEKLFLRKEYASLIGKKKSVLGLLSIIVFLSMLCIILGRGGLDHLQVKMNDPFVRWFNIKVSNSEFRDDYEDIRLFIEKSSENRLMGIESGSGSYRAYWQFYRKESRGRIPAIVQGFDYWRDSLLIKSILSKSNLLHDFGKGSLKPTDFKDVLLLTENFMAKLEVEPDDLREKRVIVRQAGNMKFRVLGVVKSLPNKSDVLCLNNLIYAVNNANEDHVNATEPNNAKKKEIIIDLQADPENREKLDSLLKNALLAQSIPIESVKRETPSPATIAHNYRLKFELSEHIKSIEKEYLEDALDNETFRRYKPCIYFEQRLPNPRPTDSDLHGNKELYGSSYMFDILSLKIDLDSISTFQEYLIERWGLELDMDQAEAKKNYSIISFLTVFLIVSLIGFAVFAIVLYCYNLMRNHLNKIRMNLGTLLAFGMEPGFLIRAYLFIQIRMLLTASLFALILVVFFETIVRFAIRPESDKLGFLNNLSTFTNSWLWLALAILFIISFITFRVQLKRFLSYPPGDLIYGRK